MKTCLTCRNFRTRLKLTPVEGVMNPTDFLIDYESAVGECAFNHFPKKAFVKRVLMQETKNLTRNLALQLAETCPDYESMEDEDEI